MSNTNQIETLFPVLANRLRRAPLAQLPTPVQTHHVQLGGRSIPITVKNDDQTAFLYGGNKVRKLEYALRPALDKHCRQVVTFGTAGSNHALATALFARQLGLGCTCFLAHQAVTPYAARTINKHIENGTRIVQYGGNYSRRIQTLRENLSGTSSWVVPFGGSSWLGTVGFVDAGLELAEQVRQGLLPAPDHIYVATGTMGTAAGLALGLALGGSHCEVQAIRVSEDFITSEKSLHRLIRKTASMLQRLDSSIPSDLAERVNIRLRHEFFGSGYAVSNKATDQAVRLAHEQLRLTLETTYTGKAMAALLFDLQDSKFAGDHCLFWNTYNSQTVDVPADYPLDARAIPESFLRYFATAD
jgi:D-cysteine desulfhydrase